MSLQCTWCCRATKTKPCEHCGQGATVFDKTKRHRPHWSQKNMLVAECLICGRATPYEQQGKPDDFCETL